jgi:hypothetical protein
LEGGNFRIEGSKRTVTGAPSGYAVFNVKDEIGLTFELPPYRCPSNSKE